MSYEMPLATVTVTSTSYPGPAQVVAGGAIAGYSFQNIDYNDTILYSFDGATDHGVVLNGALAQGDTVPGQPSSYQTTKTSVWLRLAKAGSAVVYVMGAG